MTVATLVLLRHGQSVWNAENRFTGWVDVELTERGLIEARRAGELLRAAGILPDVAHTSLLTRAIKTTALALETAGRLWVPVQRSWRLNERHYGALAGLDKAEITERFGADQVHRWRRSYNDRPPALEDLSDFRVDPRYREVAEIPSAESLADVERRLVPYWDATILPQLAAGSTVLIGAHGNSLRALVKHLEGIGDEEVTGLEIATGVPRVYRLEVRADALAWLSPAGVLGEPVGAH